MTTLSTRRAPAAPMTTVIREFRLPDLGEGLTESEILQWHVGEGDTVELNQIIADVETAKAVVELPSPYAGVVVRLHEAAGTTVDVGAPIISFAVPGIPGGSGEPDDDGARSGHPGTDGTDIGAEEAHAGVGAEGEVRIGAGADVPARREPNLVGYGAALERSGRPQRRSRRVPQSSVGDGGSLIADANHTAGVARSRDVSGPGDRPRSTPPVRKLARDLGVALDGLTGTGIDALITRSDVLAALAGGTGGAARQGAIRGAIGDPAVELPVPAPPVGVPADPHPRLPATGAPSSGVTRTLIRGMRKHTAAAMVASAFTAPHVTEFLTLDVTPTMDLLAALRASRTHGATRITPLAVVAKAVCLAVGRNPTLNSSWDGRAQEIVQYHDVNLGIAAATPRGLLVPNIKAAQSLPLVDLARALNTLAETARAGRTAPADLAGGTISITNIGVFGIDAGTPILNPGEAAILAMGAVRTAPWAYRDAVALRSVMTLSLSFDHRLVDGEQGSRFLADVGTILGDPAMVLTMV